MLVGWLCHFFGIVFRAFNHLKFPPSLLISSEPLVYIHLVVRTLDLLLEKAVRTRQTNPVGGEMRFVRGGARALMDMLESDPHDSGLITLPLHDISSRRRGPRTYAGLIYV